MIRNSRRLLLVIAALAVLASAGAALTARAAKDAIVGTWEGVLSPGGMRIRIVFRIESDETGTLKGFLDSPDQAHYGTPIETITRTPSGNPRKNSNTRGSSST